MSIPIHVTSRGLTESDVAVLDISVDATAAHLRDRILLVGSVVVSAVLGWTIIFQQVPPVILILGLLSIIPFSAWIFIHQLSRNAQRKRSDMNMAVAVFLDLVNVLLAGGAGIETAIVTAASAGDGWAFEEIRRSITRAQSARQPYWDALQETGSILGVQSLQDVAQSIRLAGEHGGRVRQSLMSRAGALRKSNLAAIEHDAEMRTERMGIPMVVMFVGFVIFIGYPAFVTTMTSL